MAISIVRSLTAGSQSTHTGKQLQDGLPVALKPDSELRLVVTPITPR